MNREDVLAMLDDQFQEARKDLSLQLTRLGQIQVQLDQTHGVVRQFVKDNQH
jgi:hypothetical protein